MMSRSVAVIFALPILIHGQMRVNIAASRNMETPSIYIEPTSNPIDDEERNTFNLTDDNLKRIIKEYFGDQPDDVYLRSPTPWNDLYVTYKWPEVHRRLKLSKLKSRKTLDRSREIIPIITLDHNITESLNLNVRGTVKTYHLKVREIVQNTITSKWKEPFGIKASNIRYEFAVNFNSGNWFSRDAEWGKGFEEKRDCTIEKQITFTTEHNETVALNLYATKTIVNIQLFYTTRLSGNVAINYNKPYRGHHFWSVPIINLMANEGLKTEMNSTEEINIEYYTDPQLIVTDYDTKTILYTFPLDMK